VPEPREPAPVMGADRALDCIPERVVEAVERCPHGGYWPFGDGDSGGGSGAGVGSGVGGGAGAGGAAGGGAGAGCGFGAGWAGWAGVVLGA
jgi:hypothetical protein